MDEQVAWLDDGTLPCGLPQEEAAGDTGIRSILVDGAGPPSSTSSTLDPPGSSGADTRFPMGLAAAQIDGPSRRLDSSSTGRTVDRATSHTRR